MTHGLSIHKGHTMHAMQGHAQSVAETARTMLRQGQRPVLVWLPLDDERRVYAAYLCEHVEATVPTYRVVASLGRTLGADDAFKKTGFAWAAMEAGAGFRRFNRRAATLPPDGAHVVMPNGVAVCVGM